MYNYNLDPEDESGLGGLTKTAMSVVCVLRTVCIELQDKTKDIHPKREMRFSVSNSRPGKFLTGGSILGQCGRGERVAGGEQRRKQHCEELQRRTSFSLGGQ